MNYMVGVGTVQHRVFKYNAAAGFLGFGISVSPMSYFFAVQNGIGSGSSC